MHARIVFDRMRMAIHTQEDHAAWESAFRAHCDSTHHEHTYAFMVTLTADHRRYGFHGFVSSGSFSIHFPRLNFQHAPLGATWMQHPSRPLSIRM